MTPNRGKTTNNGDSVREGRLVRAAGTLVLANCLVMAPLWVRSGTFGPHWIALEIAILVAVFLLLPRRRWTRVAAWGAAATILATTLLLVADSAARMSLARPLNLYLDARLVGSVQNLLDGTFGNGWGPVVLIGGVLAALGLVVVLARLLSGMTEPRAGWRPRLPALVALLLLVSLVPLRWAHPRGVVLALPVTQLAREQTKYLGSMLQERDRFAAEVMPVAAPSVKLTRWPRAS